jgi:hypothetical protein
MMTQQSSGDKRLQFPLDRPAELDIVGGTKFGRYPKISTEQTINMIVSDGALVHHYGYQAVAEIGNGTAREVYSSPKFEHLIVVVGNGVYTVGPAPYPVLRVGTLASRDGFVYIAENTANQIAIVDGSFVYIFNYATNVFTKVTVPFEPVYITYQDTYFIAADGASNQWFLSANSDGTSWPAGAGNVGLFQTKPATMVAVQTFDRQLLVMAQTGTESWTDVGSSQATPLFPYQRNNSWSIDYGCLSAQTIATGYGMTVWLGNNEKSGITLQVSTGGQPQQITNDGLEFLFSSLTAPQDSYGFLYKLDGHIYYQFTFVTDNYTFVYDFSTQMFFTMQDVDRNYHIAKRIAFFDNSYYFVSFADGKLYQMGSEFLTFNGAEIPRIRVCKNIRLPNLDRFVIDCISITLETGINPNFITGNNGYLLEEDGSFLLQEDLTSFFLLEYTPTFTSTASSSAVDLSISKDGGYSYGNIVTKYLRGLGQRANTFRFWNIGGNQNDMVLQFRFWGLGRFVIIGGEVDVHV